MNRKNWSNLFILAIARQRIIPNTVLSAVAAFGKEEDGQDLVEYSLLLSFLALSSTALLAGIGTTLKGVWTTINSNLKNAAS